MTIRYINLLFSCILLFLLSTRRWSTDLNKLEQDCRQQLADVLCDSSRPLCSVYGAVIGLLAFGLQVCRTLILCHHQLTDFQVYSYVQIVDIDVTYILLFIACTVFYDVDI